MPRSANFLLGYGERLTERIPPPLTSPEKRNPYSLGESQARLGPMVSGAAMEISNLPDLACPGDKAVAVLRLHPEFIAKSYFPGRLLREVGLEAVGSRPSRLKPQKWNRKAEPEAVETTDLFVAAPRRTFNQWSRELPTWQANIAAAGDLIHIEEVRAQRPEDRIQTISASDDEIMLEAVLHASGQADSQFIIQAFEAWAKSLDGVPYVDRRLHVGGLCFLPVLAARLKIQQLAQFSFLRVVRQMPRLRMLKPPIVRGTQQHFSCQLPADEPISTTSSVAIFDGGLASTAALAQWIRPIDPPGIGAAVPEYLEHGHQVSSAMLFGSIPSSGQPAAPYSAIDHYRVLDATSASDPLELYDVLQRIRNVLGSRRYDFVNLSIGPELPIEDTEVHAWTAFIDEHLEDGDVLAAVAVGNGGENDRQSGNARIQVPSDSVNALAIGACDSESASWQRASYSSIGPGRSPGVIKPDCLSFGGSDNEPFYVLSSSDSSRVDVTQGTSFATPSALRMALAIRSHLGPIMRPLTLKALLIHCAECNVENRGEHGWGRLPNQVENFIVCPDGTARIVYQGELSPAQFLRAQIPIPEKPMKGKVRIRATFCYATRTDPQDPGNYTRSGLDIRFRPHDQRFARRDQADSAGAPQPATKQFFQLSDFSSETELRRDAHKWETTLHRERSFLPKSLRNPVFDIHYLAREGGAATMSAQKIRYALILSVSAPQTIDLYNEILRRYATALVPLRPVIEIPLRLT